MLGTTLLAWAALRASLLPKWICAWLMMCGVMHFASLWIPLLPALGVLGIFAPLDMLGLMLLGLALLRSSVATGSPAHER